MGRSLIPGWTPPRVHLISVWFLSDLIFRWLPPYSSSTILRHMFSELILQTLIFNISASRHWPFSNSHSTVLALGLHTNIMPESHVKHIRFMLTMTQYFCYSTAKRRLQLHRWKVASSIRLCIEISTWLTFDGSSHCVQRGCLITHET